MFGYEQGAAARFSPVSFENYGRSADREWAADGGSWLNNRYSELTQINTRTVGRLGAAWVSRKFTEGATSRDTPVVKDGLMFVTAGRFVYALSATTGETVWSYKTIHDGKDDAGRPNSTGPRAERNDEYG